MKKKDAVEYYGSQVAIAVELSITEAAVSKWDEFVPIKQALRLNDKSSGELDLRLEDYRE